MLERPTSGRILVNGQDITQLNKAALRDYRLRTGMIFQHFNLLHARTVAANIAVPLEIAGVPRAAREARVRELLELVDLSEKAAAFPSQLSGGQKQRVGIARGAGRPTGGAAVRRGDQRSGSRDHRLGAGSAGGY